MLLTNFYQNERKGNNMEETFASYILSEKDWIRKMEIMYYLERKTNIFFDKSVVFKTEFGSNSLLIM